MNKNDILIHYGIKGMRWGVRKQYEGTGRSGGGGWGPNNPMAGNPLAAAASVPNNPKGKKNVGKNAVKNMGVEDNASSFKSRMEARKKEKARKKAEAEKKAKEEAFAKDFNRNWINSYNRAAERQNIAIEKVNSELSDDFDMYSEAGKEYAQKLGDSWRSIYTEELMKNFGSKSKEIGLGEDWVNVAPFMNEYDYIISDIDYELSKSK